MRYLISLILVLITIAIVVCNSIEYRDRTSVFALTI